MSDPEIDVTVEGREASPRWHLRALAVIVVVLAVAYILAVKLVLQ